MQTEAQASIKTMRITFVSQEKLGVLFNNINDGASAATKKRRAAHLRWVSETLMRLGLVDASSNWSVYAITVGTDFSGNYGVFVIQDRVIKENSNAP